MTITMPYCLSLFVNDPSFQCKAQPCVTRARRGDHNTRVPIEPVVAHTHLPQHFAGREKEAPQRLVDEKADGKHCMHETTDRRLLHVHV